MINEEELTGALRGDFTHLRVLQPNGEFVDINSLLATGASGVNDIVSGGGLAVSISNGVATITNTAQGRVGPPGSQGPKGDQGNIGNPGASSAFQTVTVNSGAGDITYDSTQVSGIKFSGAALGGVSNGILTVSGLKGDPGNYGSTPADGKDSAMQTITVGGQTFVSNILSEVVFPGATAKLENWVLTLESLQGVKGDDGLNSAMQRIEVDGQI